MAETITVNGVSLTGTVPAESVEWAESAYLGEMAEGHFTYDDVAGTKSFPGFKTISVEQSESSNARIFTGFVGRKKRNRGKATVLTTGREIAVSTYDLNDLLRRRAIWETDDNRASETISARVTWLLQTDACALFADYGAVAASTLTVDKADLRGKYPGDILADLAKAASFNYYLRYAVGKALYELVFRDDSTPTPGTAPPSLSPPPPPHH